MITLNEIRQNINKVDAQMRELFVQRMELAEQVAIVKARSADDIFKPDREIEIIENQSASIEDESVKQYKALIKKMMSVSREFQYAKTLELRDCFPIQFETEETAFCKERVIEKNNFVAQESFFRMLQTDHLFMNGCEYKNIGESVFKTMKYSEHLVVKENHNHLVVAFRCDNKCGTVANVFSLIADYEVNVSEIYTVPISLDWGCGYQFFLDIETNMLDKDAQALLLQLFAETLQFEVLGSYIG